MSGNCLLSERGEIRRQQCRPAQIRVSVASQSVCDGDDPAQIVIVGEWLSHVADGWESGGKNKDTDGGGTAQEQNDFPLQQFERGGG